MYFRMVRGDTRRPSFSRSSLAMRSSPHEGFSRAIRRISVRSSTGRGGRPRRDVHRHHTRNPWRCQRIKVCGCTMVRACRQSNQRASTVIGRRVAVVARLGLTFRSWYNASYLRRKRFPAASAAGERRQSLRYRTLSTRSVSSVPVSCCRWRSTRGNIVIAMIPP
jgi:hypothetical protein